MFNILNYFSESRLKMNADEKNQMKVNFKDFITFLIKFPFFILIFNQKYLGNVIYLFLHDL